MKSLDVLKNAKAFLALATLMVLLFPQPGLAQGEGNYRYFPETGHSVSGDFLTFFDTWGGIEIFGYPLTEPFVEKNVTVQYFQKARLEAHPENPEPYKVQLGLLGDELNYRQPAVVAPRFASRRQLYFPETGHTVSYAFLDYFKSKGGIDIFGYPITEMQFEDGSIVQYFQRLKMQWHPEDRTAPVQIGNLGELYVSIYRDRIPPEAFQVPSSPRPGPSPTVANITNIRAVVSLRYSVMGKQGNQTVSVLVTDNNGTPLANAKVYIRFLGPNSTPLSPPGTTWTTDARGFVRVSIPVTGGQTGQQVIVQADVTYGTLTATGQNVFLLWW